jgi:hypothetical protein
MPLETKTQTGRLAVIIRESSQVSTPAATSFQIGKCEIPDLYAQW